MKKPMKPMDTSRRIETKVHMLADRMFERRQELRTAAGSSTFKGEELSLEERKVRFKELISSREMLISTISDNLLVGKNGELRINRKFMDATAELSGAD